MKKRFLSMFVLLLMAATGAWAQTETLLTTITATGQEQASYSTANVATVSFSYTANGYSAYLANWGWWGYGWSATVTAAEGYTITKCVFYDNTDHTATDSEAPFVVETTENDKQPKVNGNNIYQYSSSAGIKKIDVYGYVKYSVTLAEGTEDANKWSISPASAAEGETVTITYNGTKRVKDVKVEKAPTDLSMVDCAGAARTAMSTANCYMVHTAGYYKLPLVYGNAIKNGAANTAAYTGVSGTNTTLDFPNHAGTPINAPWITKATTGTGADKGMGITVKSAELLWQDAEGLITKVGISGDYLTLTVGKDAATQEGNAVIAAKTSDGTIVWSWHIWVTKETFADATLTTIATGSHDYKVTPVNLGWVPTDDDGKQGYNTYYQWGRKDPFKAKGAPTDQTVYDIDDKAITGMTYTNYNSITIGDNIQNPTKFYYKQETNSPCGSQYYNMWDAQQGEQTQAVLKNITTATVKTVYDPCPAGFCVPTSNLFYFMGNGEVGDPNHENHETRADTDWDDTNKGKTWKQATYSASTTGPDLYFPALGYRNTNGTFAEVGTRAPIWSASPDSNRCGRSLEVYSDKWFSTWNGRIFGISVRAVAEE